MKWAGETMRIDKYLLANHLATSRNKAQYYLAEGVVTVNGKIIRKNSYSVGAEDVVQLTGNPCPYVSRGGLKMAKAIEKFKLDLTNQVIIDLGASTGGFTDCALQNGAQKVYAVDVGSDQLAISIKTDPRVVDWGGRNLRTLKQTEFKDPIELIICDDASFDNTLKIAAAVANSDPRVKIIQKSENVFYY
jgi:23S rRNA (cytidine1920-2'-O)/16S rRNA (cytidine1409-2'-O)-methyltransferase